MAPKKGQKMSLNAFLVDESLGSWADEMESLPTGPAAKTDEDRSRREFGRDHRDFPDRGPMPPREELPLPTAPPYTAFIGNLAFDLVEADLEDYFQPNKLKSIKIIKDREEKPKGFGYVEFETLDGLKDGLSRSGGTLANRQVRVSVADPPKERSGHGGGFDDEKFEGNWRRSGPLPPAAPPMRGRDGEGFGARSSPGARGPPPTSGEAENNSDWRSNRTARPPSMDQDRPAPRRGSGFTAEGGPSHAADTEETWTIGSKFKASPNSSPRLGSPSDPAGGAGRGLFGGRRGDAPPPRETATEESDWRSGPRKVPSKQWDTSRSPSTSTPPTPQMGRRKLDLLPRSTSSSVDATPNPSGPARSNPFGGAKPVDAAAREKEIGEKIEKERAEWASSRPTRTLSNTPRARGQPSSPPSNKASLPTSSVTAPSSPTSNRFTSREVSRGFSFAAAASSGRGKDLDKDKDKIDEDGDAGKESTEKVLEDKVAGLTV